MGSPSLNLLLDTHVWLWALGDPERLAAEARDAIGTAATPPRLSPISVWEATLLHERGRVVMEGGPAAWLERALTRMPLWDAPLTREVALTSRQVELSHEDPADRFLAASAVVHELTLVTADDRLLAASACEVLPAA